MPRISASIWKVCSPDLERRTGITITLHPAPATPIPLSVWDASTDATSVPCPISSFHAGHNVLMVGLETSAGPTILLVRSGTSRAIPLSSTATVTADDPVVMSHASKKFARSKYHW